MGLLLMFIALHGIGKKKRGRLVEWVKKAFFDWLNKLFVISTSEQHYETLLTDRSLLAVVQELQLYVLPILPHLVPKVLVPGEHHVLKNLSFYEEVRAADTKASSISCTATSSIAPSPATAATKRKLVLRLTKKALDLSPSASSPQLSSVAGIDQDSIGLPSTGANPNRELELMVPYNILKPKEEEK